MYPTSGGAGAGDVEGDRASCCRARLAGVETGLRSESTRSSLGEGARFRFARGAGEEDDGCLKADNLSCASQGSVRGILALAVHSACEVP